MQIARSKLIHSELRDAVIVREIANRQPTPVALAPEHAHLVRDVLRDGLRHGIVEVVGRRGHRRFPHFLALLAVVLAAALLAALPTFGTGGASLIASALIT